MSSMRLSRTLLHPMMSELADASGTSAPHLPPPPPPRCNLMLDPTRTPTRHSIRSLMWHLMHCPMRRGSLCNLTWKFMINWMAIQVEIRGAL